MREKEFNYRWEYDLRSSPEALWSFVADTNRFNRDVGLPAIVGINDAAGNRGGVTMDGRPANNARRRLALRWAGFDVRWEEEPFEWVRPFRFGVVRRYESGPIALMRVAVELHPREADGGGGTQLVYQISARPRSRFGRVTLRLQFGRRAARKFAETFRRYDELAGAPPTSRQPLLLDSARDRQFPATAPLSHEGRGRLALLRSALVEQGADPELVARLVATVERGDELTVARLRPYALADQWGASRRSVLELCLLATRAGLLDLRWDILCPLCRGPQASSASLKDVRSNLHCETCNVDFTANFDRSVEVTFRPNAAVRAVATREFCTGGPELTPHIAVQQLLPAGARRTLRPLLAVGRYRLRTLALPGGQLLSVSTEGGVDRVTLRAGAEAAWPNEELSLGTAPALSLENDSAAEQLFILERMAWADEAATAAEVTALQMFRDLFAEEALRPGDQITVGSLTILFTDLCGSTRLYREIGDAVAFGAVMNHFDVLRCAIAAEGGAIVKTLGDAVMAAFPSPAPALRAIIGAQQTLAAPPRGMRPLLLKAGIHTGACIAVTLNGRLDYFGSNVNIAARLEPLSTGRDCVISAAVHKDPSVAALLAEPGGRLAAEPLETALKGFDDERFELWRVRRRD